jgi:hypothetical protein
MPRNDSCGPGSPNFCAKNRVDSRPMTKRGPPSTFTKAIGRKLCDLVSEGTSLNAACAQLDLPRRRVRNWLVRYPSFGAEMAVAQQMHWDQMAEDVVDIIDRCDGSSQAEVTKARAASDARKWVLSKVRQAQYGDRMQLVGDPDQPLIPAETDVTKLSLMVLSILNGPKDEAARQAVVEHKPAESWRACKAQAAAGYRAARSPR